jgi:hypothetical protein
MKTENSRPAVVGQVEPSVRPHRPHWTVRNCVWGGMAWTVSLTTPTKLELGARLYSRPEVDAMIASELERIAHEPPVSGNDIAQARVLLAAAQFRGA